MLLPPVGISGVGTTCFSHVSLFRIPSRSTRSEAFTHDGSDDIVKSCADLDSTRPVGRVGDVAVVLARAKLGLVVDLHQATTVRAQALSPNSSARLTGNQLHAVSKVDDSAGSAGDHANNGSDDSSVLHLGKCFVGVGLVSGVED